MSWAFFAVFFLKRTRGGSRAVALEKKTPKKIPVIGG